MKDKIQFDVDLLDNSYKRPRHIYKITVGIDDSIPWSPKVRIEAYYKRAKSRGKEVCYSWAELDKFRFKSSYEEFTVTGLTAAVEWFEINVR